MWEALLKIIYFLSKNFISLQVYLIVITLPQEEKKNQFTSMPRLQSVSQDSKPTLHFPTWKTGKGAAGEDAAHAALQAPQRKATATAPPAAAPVSNSTFHRPQANGRVGSTPKIPQIRLFQPTPWARPTRVFTRSGRNSVATARPESH